MFSPDQFMHILTPSIWCIMTQWYYPCRTNFLIRNALGKGLQKVHLSSGQHDQNDKHMSCLPDVVLLLVTRCSYWGVCLTHVQVTLCLTVNVKVAQHSTALCHQMPLLGGTSELGMSDCNLPPQLSS